MKRIPDNKTNLVLVAILVALGVAAALTVGSSSSSGAAVTRTATAQRGVVLSSVSATGNVEASQSLNVNFITGGQVTAVDVKPGQKVTEGEVLGTIDSQSAQLAVDQAEAQLTSANAQLASANQQAQTSYAQALLALKAAKAGVSNAKAGVSTAEANQRMNGKTASMSVSQANQQLRLDRGKEARDLNQQKLDQAQLAADQQAYDAIGPTVAADQTALAAAQAKQQADQQAQYDAQATASNNNSALSSAQSQLSKDQQAETTACNAVPATPAACTAAQRRSRPTRRPSPALRAPPPRAARTRPPLQKTLSADSVRGQPGPEPAPDRPGDPDQVPERGHRRPERAQGGRVGDHRRRAEPVHDRTAIANAENSQQSGALKDSQAVSSANQAVSSAKQAISSAQLGIQTAKQANVTQQESSVAQAQANLTAAQLTLSQTTLKAPVTGTVTQVNGVVGAMTSGGGTTVVSSSSSSSSSASGSGSSTTGFVVLTNVSGLQVTAGFSETDVAKIKDGQPAAVTVDALPGTKLAAHVVAIDTTATVVSNVVTYNVTFAFDNPTPAAVKPGMTAEVDVIVAEADNVVHVTSSAVTGTGTNGSVTVLVGKQQTVRPVVVGLRGDTTTEIVSGLKAGETVVLPTLNISSSSSSSSPFGSTSTTSGRTGTFRGGGGGFGGGGAIFGGP